MENLPEGLTPPNELLKLPFTSTQPQDAGKTKEPNGTFIEFEPDPDIW